MGPGRVKVVHVVTTLELGGAQQNTLYTAAHLDPARFDCLVVAGPGGALEAEAASAVAPARLKILPSLTRPVRPLRDVLAFWELVTLFLTERPDVAHTHSSKAGVLGRLAAALAGVPVVVHTYHGFGFNDYQPFWSHRFYLALERLCCRLTDRIVFVSRANEEYARARGLPGLERAALIRSGVKLSDFPARVADRAAQRAACGIGRHRPLVVSIGNLKPQKNPGDFVAAAQEVAAAVPDAHFLFVGDGPLRAKLEYQIIASGLSSQLTLGGWRRDVAELLAVSDVFVLTSLWEGLPRALVEAMKTGLPCVCYATDGVKDVIQDGVNGYAIAPGDIASLAARVTVLLKDEALRKKIGAAAAASIGPEFDIDGMVRAQERLYEQELARDG